MNLSPAMKAIHHPRLFLVLSRRLHRVRKERQTASQTADEATLRALIRRSISLMDAILTLELTPTNEP